MYARVYTVGMGFVDPGGITCTCCGTRTRSRRGPSRSSSFRQGRRGVSTPQGQPAARSDFLASHGAGLPVPTAGRNRRNTGAVGSGFVTVTYAV